MTCPHEKMVSGLPAPVLRAMVAHLGRSIRHASGWDAGWMAARQKAARAALKKLSPPRSPIGRILGGSAARGGESFLPSRTPKHAKP